MKGILLALVLAAAPQEAPDQDRRFADEATRILFERAVAVQTPGGEAPEIADFQADLKVSLFEAEGRGAQSGSVTEFWRRKGRSSQYHRILSTDVPGGKTTHLATDGRRFLMWEEGGPVRDLVQDSALAEDLKQLKEERRRTEELLHLFFLANLDDGDVSLSLGGERELTVESAGKVRVQEIVRKKAGEPTIVLLVGKDDARLYGARLVDPNPGKAGEEFRFDFHRELRRDPSRGGGAGTILMPTRVEYWRNGRKLLEASARRPSDIKFNVGLTDADFGPPAR